MGRLRTLERLGLASELEPGVWRIAPETDTTLRRMGERADIIRTVQRDLAHALHADLHPMLPRPLRFVSALASSASRPPPGGLLL